MADTKISALAALTSADPADLLAIVDSSANTTKKITVANIGAAIGGVGIFRPESYGAAADGTTDDTTAIQAAVTAASAAGGGIVQFDAATYLTDSVNMADKVSMRGLGRGASVLKLKNSGNSAVFEGLNADQFTISDLSINGNKANQASGDAHGIRLRTCTEVIVRNVEAYDCFKDGFYVSDCDDVLHEFCYSHDNGRNGFSCGDNVGTTSNRIAYVSCVSENHSTLSTDIGFALEPASNSRVVDCTSTNDAYGITIADGAAGDSCIDNVVSGCRITDCDTVGIYAGAGLYGGKGIQIHNCTIVGNASTGIGIDAHTPTGAGVELIISGCKITSANPTSVATHGVKVANAAAAYWSISNCTIHDLGGHGIWVAAGEGGTVTGNLVYNCSRQSSGTYDAIRLGATSNDIAISGNRIFDDQGTETTGYGVRGDSGADYIHLSGNSFGTFATGETTGLGANSSGVWLTFTPTWSNLTVGNSGVTARYFRTGKKVDVMVHVEYGSTASMGAAPRFTLPSTAADVYQGAWSASAYDISGTLYTLGVQPRLFNTTTSPFMTAMKADSTYVYTVGMSTTIPFTWATGDWLTIQGYYEEA